MGTTAEGQLINTAAQMGLSTIPEEINHKTNGTTAFLLEKPEGASYLILHIENESFRAKVGDHTGTLTYATPSADVTDGTGTFLLEELEIYVFTPPKKLTLVPQSLGALITYAWV